jgi:hypothetical protein
MTNHYEQSKTYAENGEYARAQTFALLAIADRLENVGGAPAAPAPEVVNDLADMMGANDDLMRRLEQMTRWRNGQAEAAENAEMEAAYLRAGLERLLESFLSSTLTGIQRRHVQSVLDHTWTPA